MRHALRETREQTRDCGTLKTDRSEFAEVLYQAGTPEGFSLEWVFDRFDQTVRFS
ncbi:MAG: hypothetical protein ABJ327_12480 [Litoreibacter sp.]